MGDGDQRVEALRARLEELKAQAARIDEELRAVRGELRECDSPTAMILELASRGPFSLPQAVEATGRRYDHVSVTCAELVRRGRLVRLGRGTYAAHPEAAKVETAEPAPQDLPAPAPQAPSPGPAPQVRHERPGRGVRAPAAPPVAEPIALANPREWMDVDEEGLPEVTSPIGTAAWRLEMKARRDARRDRRLPEEDDAVPEPHPVLLGGADGPAPPGPAALRTG